MRWKEKSPFQPLLSHCDSLLHGSGSSHLTWITFGLCLIHNHSPRAATAPVVIPCPVQGLLLPRGLYVPALSWHHDTALWLMLPLRFVETEELWSWWCWCTVKGCHIFKNYLLKRCSEVGRDFSLQVLLQVWLSHSIAKCHLSFSASSVNCLAHMIFPPFVVNYWLERWRMTHAKESQLSQFPSP